MGSGLGPHEVVSTKHKRALRGLDVPSMAAKLSAFIADELHYRPDGQLTTLHEVNVAFSRCLKAEAEETVEASTAPRGVAAALLLRTAPELFHKMRLLAPSGHRSRGWKAKRSTEA